MKTVPIYSKGIANLFTHSATDNSFATIQKIFWKTAVAYIEDHQTCYLVIILQFAIQRCKIINLMTLEDRKTCIITMLIYNITKRVLHWRPCCKAGPVCFSFSRSPTQEAAWRRRRRTFPGRVSSSRLPTARPPETHRRLSTAICQLTQLSSVGSCDLSELSSVGAVFCR